MWLGVRWNSIRRRICLASSAGKDLQRAAAVWVEGLSSKPLILLASGKGMSVRPCMQAAKSADALRSATLTFRQSSNFRFVHLQLAIRHLRVGHGA